MPRTTEAYIAASPPLDVSVAAMRAAGLSVDEAETITPLEGTLMSPETYLTNGLSSAFDKDPTLRRAGGKTDCQPFHDRARLEAPASHATPPAGAIIYQ